MSDRKSCDNCAYWNSAMAAAEDDNYGWCVRYAPRPTVMAERDLGNVLAVWPITGGVDCCGEFKTAWADEE